MLSLALVITSNGHFDRVLLMVLASTGDTQMATDVGVGDVIEVVPTFSSSSGTAINSLLYLVTRVIDNTSTLPAAIRVPIRDVAPDLAAEFFDNIAGGWAPGASAGVSLVGLGFQSVRPTPRSLQFNHVPSAPVPGTVAGDMMPLQDSPTIVKRTEFGTRWGVGRTFFVGLAESQQEAGVLNAAGVNSVQNYADTIGSEQTYTAGGYAFTFRLCLYGGPTGGTPEARTVLDCELSDRVIKTQRRRRPGKGQ